MKNLVKLSFGALMLLLSIQGNSQTVVAGGSPLFLPCGGGVVDLTAVGTATTPVFGDDFNTGTVAAGWSTTPAAASFTNPCGAPVDGTTYLWMGSGTTAPRAMTTAPVDVSCGGTVCFDFKFTCESCGDFAPCEGADFYNEGVSLQFSTGGPFVDFAYFAPNGDILLAYPGAGVTAPGATGATPFTTWNNYCFTIPAAAYSATTVFRLRQWGSSGSGFDHWGIDNFYVYADPCSPYYYDWDHIPGAPDAPDVSTVVTESGTYTVCYTNGVDAACDDVTIIVDEIDITGIAITPEPCLGDDAGSITITVAGGTGPYTYDLSGPTSSSSGTGSFTGLAPGLYTITISDATTCVVDSSFTIPPGIPCCTVTATSTDALCNGGATGTATANPSGGTAPYAYEWFDAGGTPIGITTQVAGGLPAGDYSVEITDATGCTSTTVVTVGEPAAISAGTTVDHVSCNSFCDGSITVDGASGGTPGYTYNINGGIFQVSNVFTGLCAGTYTIIVKDANGCTFTIPGIVVTEPVPIDLTLTSITHATCGDANGVINVGATGGTGSPSYDYTLGGVTNASGLFTGLAAGSYTVDLVDSEGCTASITVVVEDEEGPLPFVDVLNDVTCNGGLNGSVTIGVTGGDSPYTFALDGGAPQPSNTFPFVAAGPHTVVVTDNNGCTGSVDFVIGEPTALTYTTTITNASCNGVCDGEIDINASGATPPYTYSDDAGASFTPSDILTGLCAGPVNVVVQDANGCLANSLVIITEPTVVTSTAAHVEPSCNGLADGEISFTPSGGTPGYTYSVNDGISFSGTSPVTGIAAGDYDLVVEDANGCQFSFTHTVNEPPPFTFTYIANNPSNCGANDGSFEIIATDGLAPYDYSIDGGTTWEPDGLFDGLFSGLYTLVVEDANGCIDSVFEALSDNVMESSTLFANDATCFNGCDGSLGVTQLFGAPPYTYTIHTAPGAPQPFGTFFGLCEGTYYVTIEDDGLCIAIEEIYIGEPDTITFDPTGIDISCPSGSDGEIHFGAVTGGDGGPYTYSIDGGGAFSGSPDFTGLIAGTYTIYAQDGNGCLGSTTITLDQPDPITSINTVTDLLCNGDASGALQAVADGGTPGYTYDIGGAPAPTGIFPGLAAGPYTITVTDANGCTETFNEVINEPVVLSATYTITDASCNATCDGEVDVDAAGGTTPYLYSADGGVFLSSSDVLSGLCAGDHDIYVVDDNGCNITSTETIVEPTPLSMTLATVPATCGLNNGEVTITAAGGTPGYTYSNDSGGSFQVSNLFAGLSPINYTLVLEDANGCQIDSIITISADDLPVIDNVITTDPLCNGASNGTIEIISSGGVGAHQYSVGGPYQASNLFTGLAAGIYTVQVQDANGCITSMDVELVDPPLLAYAAAITDLLCNGDLTGQIVLSPSGGTAPYQYSITGGAPFAGGGTFSFIAAGAYNVVVQDANGCQATGVEAVNEPGVLDWDSFVITDPLCNGDCNGTVATTLIGGTGPFSYFWTGGIEDPADEANASGVCDGTYSVMVTDANGCDLDSMNFVVNEPVPVPINGVTVTDLLCFEDATGELSIDAPTAVSYDLPGTAYTDGDLTGVYTGLDAGNYNIVVTDATGCTATTNTTIYEPAPLEIFMPSDWPTCYGYTVTVQAYVTGGTEDYSYSWTNDLDATVETTQTFDAVITTATTYTLVVTDANGCVVGPDSYVVSPSPSLAVTAAAIPDAMICLGESVDLDADAIGGQLIDFGSYFGYSYSWDTGIPGDTLEVITVSPTVPTDYTVTVTDYCGQVVDAVVSIGIHPDPIIDITGGGNGCVPELMAFTNPSFAAGSTSLWEFGDGATSTDNGSTEHLYIYAGCFDVTLTVTSDQGCTVSDTFDDLVCIYDNPKAGFYWSPNNPSLLDPTIEVLNTSVNAVTYEYDFAGGFTSTEENPTYTFPSVEEETDFEVCQLVTSAEGCRDSVCQTVTVLEEIIFYVPNVFTPDGDQYNEEFKPIFTTGVDPYQYHLIIFNRWGEVVFESFNYDFGWSGVYGDRGLVEDGVYIWQIEFGEKNTDKKQIHRGHVTVLK